jgi:hypothetical protein
LGWITDLAAFVRTHTNRLDWRRVAERAGQWGCERQLLLGLHLSSDLLGTGVPSEILPRMRSDRAVSSLAMELRHRLFGAVEDPGQFQGSYSFVEGTLLYIRTRERMRDKLPCAYYFARQLLQRGFSYLIVTIRVNDKDRAVVALPKSIAFLYYAIRAVRVTRKHGLRLVQRYWKRMSANAGGEKKKNRRTTW